MSIRRNFRRRLQLGVCIHKKRCSRRRMVAGGSTRCSSRINVAKPNVWSIHSGTRRLAYSMKPTCLSRNLWIFFGTLNGKERAGKK
jgi:hypothetical protein